MCSSDLATEAFSKKNTNCTIAEGVARFSEVCDEALKHGIKVRGDMSVCLGCPYEGEVSAEAVARLAQQMAQIGCGEVTVCDTIGTGTPGKMKAAIEAVAKHIAIDRIAVHVHDTYGQAIANIYAALECGISIYDSSVAGLGGCPYEIGRAHV